MLKKILTTIKATVLLWMCILVPIFIGAKVIKSSTDKDVVKCIESFMETECIGLVKYIGLQFNNTQKQIEAMLSELQLQNLNNPEAVHDTLVSFVKNDKSLISINIYHEDGMPLSSSSTAPVADLMKDDKYDNIKKDEILYSIEQLEENNDIAIKYVAAKEMLDGNKNKKFFIEATVKWDKYESYMNQLHVGSFPRMFYIVSPDCSRYVSMNSLPHGLKSKRSVAALGLHLVSKMKSIKSGLSEIEIESSSFRLFKEEIKIPDKMLGNKFFIIVATDEEAFENLSQGMLKGIPLTATILIFVLLVLCIIIARFLNKTKDQLEIANTISDSTPQAIVIFRASDGKIMQINLSAKTLFRVSKESMETVNIWNIFISNEDKEYISNAIASKIQVLNYEVLTQSFGGGNFWSICSASPIDIEEERYIVLAILDINSRKEIEKKLANNAELLEKQIIERTADIEIKAKQLEESNLMLEKARITADEANAAKSKFLTNMSNELKTPINAIIGYSEILQEEALDRKDTVSSDDLRKIIGSAKHLLSLIDEILDLSKIEAGKTQLFFEHIDIISMVKDVEGVTMPLIANNDNSLFIEFSKDIGTMYTDGTKIRQCLLNLLSNSAKFTEFGKITLRVTPVVKGGIDFIEFAIIDTGVGIQPERIDTIFEPFQESESKGAGAGLGLSLTKKYVGYLGGEVLVESEVGIGSKFIIRAPRISTVVSNEFIEVKNKFNEDEEIVEEFSENPNDYEYGDSKSISSFTRKSDL